MKINNVQVLMPSGVFRNGSVEFDETIQEVKESASLNNPAGPYLIPGLIDLHTHGALGGDHTDGDPEKLREMAAFYAKNGVTSFLATTLTDTEETLSNAMRCIAGHEKTAADGKPPANEARCIGINLEGPFFSREKRGAHRADLLKAPDIAMLTRLHELSGGRIKLVCVSPELEGAQEFIKAASKVCRVSLAHTAAGYDTAMQGFSNGATHVTHLFNGMAPYSHREPGLVGAAFDAGAFVEVISDGYHLHRSVIRAAFKMFPGRVCLISDSLRCTGLPDGDYMSAGLPITVTGGKAMLKDGGSLAGSTISLMQGVKRAVAMGIPLAEAVMAASANCARAIGMEDRLGTIAPGINADMVLLDSNLNIQKVYISGVEVNT